MKKDVWAPLAVIASFIIIVFVGVIALRNKNSQANNNKVQVVASFYPLYFFSSEIGGSKAEVTNIVPAGAEPHDYEPTAQDMAKMEGSKLIVLNGGGLEAWGDNIKKNIDSNKTVIVTAGEGLTTQQVEEEGQTITDPHVWLDPPLAEKMVDKIAQGFESIDPANKDYYQTNAQTLKNKLANLDADYRQGLAHCAEKNIITSHAAFGYLATTYGLNQVPIAGLSPDAEPSPAELADIAKFATENNVKYIFFEALVSPKLSQTIATEIGAKTLVLDPIEGIEQTAIDQGKNYLAVMRNNLTNLQTALQCSK